MKHFKKKLYNLIAINCENQVRFMLNSCTNSYLNAKTVVNILLTETIKAWWCWVDGWTWWS